MRYVLTILALLTLIGCAATIDVTKQIPPQENKTMPFGEEPEEKKENDLGISLPPGFSIEVYASVAGARSLARGAQGTIFVGTRGDKVYAVIDSNQDNTADEVKVIAKNLKQPNGVAFRDGDLYVAEINRILRFDEIESSLDEPSFEIISDEFPKDTHHGWKFVAFGPDGKLYVPLGAPCNVCDEAGYGAIYRLNPDGSGKELFVSGVRNTVGFDWHPLTHELYFTDNGRDWLGNDAPHDELNKAADQGMHFGFPFCHSTNTLDPEFGRDKDCQDYEKPILELGPHVAALGMRFYTGSMFPEEYRNQIFIAEHGSWNRDDKIGYRITLARETDGLKYETFASGWLQGNKVKGRPVDILIMPDGSMLVSDDHAGKIYRIWYG